MEKGKFIQLLPTPECEKFPGGDPIPAWALCRAVLVLLRLCAFLFKPGVMPAWLSALNLCCLLFQYLKNKFL